MKVISRAHLFALGAIALWASLAALGVALQHVPPFLMTGIALLVGSLVALPLSGFDWRVARMPWPTLALGVYGLFGYHFLLFMALRHAPPVQANLINYLWPLGMVVMAPLFLPGTAVTGKHLAAAVVGFAGAALAITGGQDLSGLGSMNSAANWGYLWALGAAFVWASYSLMTQRVAAFPTAALGLFGLVSGLLALGCHFWLERPVVLDARDWLYLMAMGLGPLGAAFYLWDAALKRGDARQIGLLSFLTPLGSTLVLLWVRGESPSLATLAAAVLIVGAAWVGTRKT
jgi:drug/metabolite transporter (DMT)-like permease